MAVAVLTANVPSIESVWLDGRMLHVIGTITMDGGTYAANGLTLPLNNPLIKAQRPPKRMTIRGQANQNAQTQYDYTYIPGTDNTNGIMKIFTGGSEVGTGAMPAGVSGDTIEYEALFLGQN